MPNLTPSGVAPSLNTAPQLVDNAARFNDVDDDINGGTVAVGDSPAGEPGSMTRK